MTRRMKLNYNGFVESVADVLSCESIEDVQLDAFGVEVGLQLLNSYLFELAEHAIEAEDEWLLEWCKNLMIVTETDDGGKEE